MVEIKTDTALEAMREAGRVVAHALAAARAAAAVRVRLRELDEAARAVLTKAGARSPFLGYQPSFAPTPFPAVICASVNDAVSHGIPDDYRLRDGDLVSIDCGAELDGWTGDAAISFTVGTPRPADLELIAATQQALDAGIAAATVGHRIGDISHAISTVARKADCGMPADFGGHGIGRQMHEDPHVPNHGRPGRGFPCATASPSPSNPCSWPEDATTTTPTPTGGPCAPSTAAEPPTSNTPLPSPRTAPVSSPCPDVESAPSRPPDTSAGVELPFHHAALAQAGRAQVLVVPVLDLRTRPASGPRPRGCWTCTPVISKAPRWARTGT